jgi:hypothetical protein
METLEAPKSPLKPFHGFDDQKLLAKKVRVVGASYLASYQVRDTRE